MVAHVLHREWENGLMMWTPSQSFYDYLCGMVGVQGKQGYLFCCQKTSWDVKELRVSLGVESGRVSLAECVWVRRWELRTLEIYLGL